MTNQRFNVDLDRETLLKRYRVFFERAPILVVRGVVGLTPRHGIYTRAQTHTSGQRETIRFN